MKHSQKGLEHCLEQTSPHLIKYQRGRDISPKNPAYINMKIVVVLEILAKISGAV